MPFQPPDTPDLTPLLLQFALNRRQNEARQQQRDEELAVRRGEAEFNQFVDFIKAGGSFNAGQSAFPNVPGNRLPLLKDLEKINKQQQQAAQQQAETEGRLKSITGEGFATPQVNALGQTLANDPSAENVMGALRNIVGISQGDPQLRDLITGAGTAKAAELRGEVAAEDTVRGKELTDFAKRERLKQIIGQEDADTALMRDIRKMDLQSERPLTLKERQAEENTQARTFNQNASLFVDEIQPFYLAAMDVKEDARAGDPFAGLAMVIAFARTNDPGGVVREGEVAVLREISGIPEQLKRKVIQIFENKGGVLTPAEVGQIDRAISKQMKSKLAAHSRREKTARNIANRRKLDAEIVVPDLVDPRVRRLLNPRMAAGRRAEELRDLGVSNEESKRILIDEGFGEFVE